MSVKALTVLAFCAVLTIAITNIPSASALNISEISNQPSDSALSSYPYPNASLVKDGGTIYFIYGTTKVPFANYKAFTGLGYSLRNVVSGDLSSYSLNSYIINTASIAHPWGNWVSYKGVIYYSSADGMIGVPSAEVFLSNGGKWGLVIKANKYDISSIAASKSLPILSDSDARVAGQPMALQFGGQPTSQNNSTGQNSGSSTVATTTPTATTTVVSAIPQLILPTNVYASSTANFIVVSGATNTPLTYTFFWDDGTLANTLSINTAVHTYYRTGTYMLEATVTDSLNNSYSTTAPVTVVAPPTQTPTAPQITLPKGIIVGAEATVSASATDPQNLPLSYTFSWGDGSADTVAASNSATHVYSTSENFVVKVTATNGFGFSNFSQGYLYVAP